MAPTLRSSAQSTPTSNASAESEPSTPTRKVHTCSKCKRPRAGHPRSGCPYADETPTKNATSQTPSPLARKNIEDAMGSMFLASSSPSRSDDDTKSVIRNRRQSSRAPDPAAAGSLLSLDGESQEIIERLTQPGMFDNANQASPSRKTPKVVRWQETLTFFPPDPVDKVRRIKMPGSLFTPSPESSFGSVVGVDKKASSSNLASIHIVADHGDSTKTAPDPVSSPASTSRTLQPSGDSMTIQQRGLFLTSLSNFSDATIYVVPRDDIHNLQAEAIKLGFYVRVVLTKDPKDNQGLLILGRHEPAVNSLHERVETERRMTSSFRAAAGGAVVGAVGTFAGLAFA